MLSVTSTPWATVHRSQITRFPLRRRLRNSRERTWESISMPWCVICTSREPTNDPLAAVLLVVDMASANP